jgi:hypothetical protein
MNLEEARRLGSVGYQLVKEAKRLRSIQTRTLALLAEANLPAADPALAAEVMDTLAEVLAHAASAITVMEAALATARQASDDGVERDCDD